MDICIYIIDSLGCISEKHITLLKRKKEKERRKIKKSARVVIKGWDWKSQKKKKINE